MQFWGHLHWVRIIIIILIIIFVLIIVVITCDTLGNDKVFRSQSAWGFPKDQAPSFSHALAQAGWRDRVIITKNQTNFNHCCWHHLSWGTWTGEDSSSEEFCSFCCFWGRRWNQNPTLVCSQPYQSPFYLFSFFSILNSFNKSSYKSHIKNKTPKRPKQRPFKPDSYWTWLTYLVETLLNNNNLHSLTLAWSYEHNAIWLEPITLCLWQCFNLWCYHWQGWYKQQWKQWKHWKHQEL